MKIISKYKDFYDYIVQDYDADLIYNRAPILIYENYDDIIEKNNNHVLGRFNLYNRRYYKTKPYDMFLSKTIFGIYPYVYSAPMVTIDTSDTNVIYKRVPITRGIIQYLLEDKRYIQEASTYEDGLQQLIWLGERLFDFKKKVSFDTKNLKERIKSIVWKEKCPEIFYNIKAPVFVEYSEDLFQDGAYWKDWNTYPEIHAKDKRYKSKYGIQYIANVSFQKLNLNILKYWYDELFDLNTYINIENFLWSIKQEPESNPDNKTKILAHGFDLKTSFRNVK